MFALDVVQGRGHGVGRDPGARDGTEVLAGLDPGEVPATLLGLLGGEVDVDLGAGSIPRCTAGGSGDQGCRSWRPPGRWVRVLKPTASTARRGCGSRQAARAEGSVFRWGSLPHKAVDPREAARQKCHERLAARRRERTAVWVQSRQKTLK